MPFVGLDRLSQTLARLKGSFGRKTEEAYVTRDGARDSNARSYADGQASAYTDAEEDIRDEEDERA